MEVSVYPRAWDEEVESATGSCKGFQVQPWGLDVVVYGFVQHGDLVLGSSFLEGGPA